MKVKFTQLSTTLCNPMDCRVHGILQARILERVAILFSGGFSQSRDRIQVSCIAGEFFTVSATKEAMKNLPVNAGEARDVGSISGRALGGGNRNPLQYSCLENPTDRGAWQASVYGFTRVSHDLATKQPPLSFIFSFCHFN